MQNSLALSYNELMKWIGDSLQTFDETKCFYCDREGGVSFLVTGDGEVHCSRCFEDMTSEEFMVWLEESPLVSSAQRIERPATEFPEVA